jgi:hypothetical protein
LPTGCLADSPLLWSARHLFCATQSNRRPPPQVPAELTVT